MTSAVPARRTWLLGLLVAAMAAELIAVTLTAVRHEQHGGILGAALAVDMLFLAGAGVWLAGGPRAAGLDARRLVRLAAVSIVLCALAARLAGVPLGPAPLALAALAELALAAVVLRAVARAALRSGPARWEEAARSLRAVAPAPVAEALLFELRLLDAAIRGLLRRPLTLPAPSDTVFPPMAASQSGWLIPVVLLASLVELPALHLLIATFAPGHGWLHGVVIALTGYSLLWLWGDRRWMRESAHRLEADALVLQLGMRWSGRVPYPLIQRALPLRTDAERRSVQPPKGKNPQLTPLDAPNVHLCLSAPVELTTFFGRKRPAQHLDLFVDRPEELLAALARYRASRSDLT